MLEGDWWPLPCPPMAFIVQSRLHTMACESYVASSSQIDFLLILYMSSSYLVLRSFLQAFPSSPNALPLASAGLAMSRHYDSAPVTSAALSQTSHILITHIIPWELSTFFQASTTPWEYMYLSASLFIPRCCSRVNSTKAGPALLSSPWYLQCIDLYLDRWASE